MGSCCSIEPSDGASTSRRSVLTREDLRTHASHKHGVRAFSVPQPFHPPGCQRQSMSNGESVGETITAQQSGCDSGASCSSATKSNQRRARIERFSELLNDLSAELQSHREVRLRCSGATNRADSHCGSVAADVGGKRTHSKERRHLVRQRLEKLILPADDAQDDRAVMRGNTSDCGGLREVTAHHSSCSSGEHQHSLRLPPLEKISHTCSEGSCDMKPSLKNAAQYDCAL